VNSVRCKSLWLPACAMLILAGCGSLPFITPTVQRVIVQADTATMYQISGERRLYKPLYTLRRGDTVFSYAQVVLQADSLERYFYVVHRGAQGWIYQGSGRINERIVVSEYDLAASVCDTKFTLPPEADEQAWKRALDYVKRHSVRPLQTMSDVLIENSLRGKIDSERDIVFVVKRAVLADGVAYTVKADGSFSSVNARKCALFMQTGKDERTFHGIETIENLSKPVQKPY
jgi:hypothetical protein